MREGGVWGGEFTKTRRLRFPNPGLRNLREPDVCDELSCRHLPFSAVVSKASGQEFPLMHELGKGFVTKRRPNGKQSI